MKKLIAIFSLFSSLSFAQISPTLNNALKPVNGYVFTAAVDTPGNRLFIGGSFRAYDPYFTSFVKASGVNLNEDRSWPMIKGGGVNVVIPDGSGGVYIGGSFDMVGGQTRRGIAQINSLGNVTTFAADVNVGGIVYDLLLNAGVLYAGGTFMDINAMPRNNMAALNPSTGVPTASVFDTDASVSKILATGTSLIVGGTFNMINSIPRNYLANVTPGGTVLPLNASLNGQVDDMELSASGTQLFIAGNFNSVFATTRISLASIDLITNNITNWDPNPDLNALSIERLNDKMVVSGSFNNIGGLARSQMALLDTIGGNAIAGFICPAASPMYNINRIRVFGTAIYACGPFNSVNGQARSGMFVTDAVGTLSNINCFNGDDQVYDVFFDGSNTFIGGQFLDYGGFKANSLASLDLTTLTPTGTVPGTNDSYIYKLRVAGDTLFGVGEFQTFGDSARKGGFAYKIPSNTILNWNPDADDKIFDFQIRGNEILVAGMFDTLQGQQKFHLGKISRNTGALLPWSCVMNGDVYDVNIRGNNLYATGAFTNAAGNPRNYFAEIDYTSGTVLPLDANADMPIYETVLRDSLLYFSGNFLNIFGQPRLRIACVNLNTGTLTSFNPGANNYVESMCLSGDGLFIGGAFSTAGGNNVGNLACIDVNSGLAEPWVMGADDLIHAILPIPNNRLLVMGEMSNIDANPAKNIALFNCATASGSVNTAATVCVNGFTVLNSTSGNSTSYQWYVNPGSGLVPVYDNPNYLGATSSSLNVYTVPQSFSSNTYRLRFGNNCSYTMSSPLNFAVLSPTVTAVSNDSVLTCPTDFATLHGNGPSGASYTWTGPSGFYSNNQTVQVNMAGSYSVTANQSGCSASDAIMVVNNPTASLDVTLTVTPATCGTNNGQLAAAVSGGTGNYSYLWTNGDVGTFADSLKIGRTYYVEVKDMTSGCKGSANAPIPSTGGATITPGTVQGVTCAGLTNGSINTTLSGGTPPYNIKWIGWSYNTAAITNLQAGIYEMVVTDAAGCVSTYTANVSGPAPLSYTLNTTPTPCGINNGIASLNLSGGTPPYSVSWLPSGTGTSISNLAAGSYTFTIQDNNACMVQDIAAVSSNSPVFVSVINSIPAICGTSNGMIHVNAINGTGPYNYLWNNGSTGASLSNVNAGNYIVGVTDLGTACTTFHKFEVEKTTENYSPEICTITVDTSNNTNILVWENGGVDGIKEYKVWRATNDPEVYQYLTTMPSGSGNLEFHDVYIDASMKPYGYKITAIDSCNEETGYSIAEHRPLCLYVDLNGAQTQARLVWTEYLGNFYNQIYIWKYNPGTNWVLIDSVLASAPAVYFDNNPQVGDIYLLEASLMNDCDPARGVINTTRSNIKTTSKTSTGIKDERNISSLIVYPNPSNGIFTLKTEDSSTEYDIEVLNALGQNIVKRSKIAGTSSLDLSFADAGIYYLKVINGQNTSMYKLILKH